MTKAFHQEKALNTKIQKTKTTRQTSGFNFYVKSLDICSKNYFSTFA